MTKPRDQDDEDDEGYEPYHFEPTKDQPYPTNNPEQAARAREILSHRFSSYRRPRTDVDGEK